MSVETAMGAGYTLDKAYADLSALDVLADVEITSVAKAFRGLTGYTDHILQLASGIVSCVESESVSSVLPKVKTLGAAANKLVADRLQASTGILEMVGKELGLLHQLSQTTHAQRAIAAQTESLRVLTNIEVGRLGAEGANFHSLVHDLEAFSKSVTQNTHALDTHTKVRRAAIEVTKQVLSAELPGLRSKLAAIEVDLGKALAVIETSLAQLSSTPGQFKVSVQEMAEQVTGVVTAIQSHDITRQQIEHVREAFTLISNLCTAGSGRGGAESELSQADAGLRIQSYQLQAIRQTIAGWASQIRTSMENILRVSSSELAGIGPQVLSLEARVAAQLVHMEVMESESQSYSERIQGSLAGLSTLMQLFGEHLQKSKAVRDGFQMLSFNSIIQASRLGKKADAMLAISRRIGEVSEEWNRITNESGHAMLGLTALVEHSNEFMAPFSEASNQQLREVQGQTREGLEALRNAAALAQTQSVQLKQATDEMQARMAGVGRTGELLDSCFSRFDAILSNVEEVRRRLNSDYPELAEARDFSACEKMFGSGYTTEIEREVMQAALRGSALPLAQAAFGGNSVELF